MTLQERSELTEKVANLAVADENFKAELTADPQGTLEKMGVSFAEGVEIQVNDQSDASKFHINIPASADGYTIELSEEELEAVSGGSDYFSSWFCNNTTVVVTGDDNDVTVNEPPAEN